MAFQLKTFFIVFTFLVKLSAQTETDEINQRIQSITYEEDANEYISNDIQNDEKVEIKLYYETLCPYCIDFDTNQLKPVIEELSEYLNIYTYPYGNAMTNVNNGVVTFQCQHGEKECYGNRLHACALDIIPDQTLALLYNACMMTPTGKGRGSDDAAADRCGKTMNVNSRVIKTCAKGARGTELLKYYGDETKKARFSYVPYVLINGRLNEGDNLLRDVCRAFTVSPPPCQKYGF